MRVRRPPAWRGRSRVSPWNNEEILRQELFSVERLEQHATSLAIAQQVTPRPARRLSLVARLGDDERALLQAYRAIADAVGGGGPITPAAEWLLENFHLVEAQIREIRNDLPSGYYRQLPKLAGGPLAGYPRVLGIAWAFVAHTDSHFDPESLRRFVRGYQKVQPLTIGELWAIAITLRIVLVENLRRAAQRIVEGRNARRHADEIADRLLGLNGHAPQPDALEQCYATYTTLPRTFVVQLVQRLRDQDPKVTPALMWLEEQLSTERTSAEAVVHEEHQRQGGSNVTVRNIITSMRAISELEWPEFFEGVSLVDEALRESGDFAQMDFATRNLYRTAIEQLARGSGKDELEVARAAIAASRRDADAAPRTRDPGYHLIGAGREALGRELGLRASPLQGLARWILKHAPPAYLGAIALLTALGVACAVVAGGAPGTAPWMLALLAAVALIPASDAAVALVNRLVPLGFAAQPLPCMALRDGIPEELRTLVAVPMLLTSAEAIEAQVEGLEIHHLSSPDGALHFALLSDWIDAPTEQAPQDAALLATATRGIEMLNRRHAPLPSGPRFLLLHRRRVWSEVQRCWMGWERKRGKLHELNALLRGVEGTSFTTVDGSVPAVPASVRYVITLDADTRLPRDTVRKLIGKLSHPLNRPRFDAASGRIVEGYAVLQPRVTPSLPTGDEGSAFRSIVSSAPGLDPYAAAVSDVYQDLFAAGSYAGKGIYDVDAFEAALAGRVADGTLLSHDLFEGTFARTGFASDVEVVEEFPSRYDVAAARQHRWARGDWQLLPWLLGRRHEQGGDRRRSALAAIDAWKMLDNLRRSLSAPAALLALAIGWTLPPQAALAWTGVIVAALALPALLPVLAALVSRRAGRSARSHLRALGADCSVALRQVAFQLVFLPHQAWLMLDAIGRTSFRLLVTRRNLLEWVTAAQAAERQRPGVAASYRGMAGGVAVAVTLGTWAVAVARGASWIALAPLLCAWLLAPAIAAWLSASPRAARRPVLSDDDADELRGIARRTWRYFETFATAEDCMLPPDNFQEDPVPVLAHRSSPTNFGLYLLATTSAREFGWLGTVDAAERIEACLATMGRLQRHRGHFLNWYDTRDLRPLEPRYVSSVDSGNLAAHLVAVAEAACAWIDAPLAAFAAAGGVRDAARLTLAARAQLAPTLSSSSTPWQPFDAQLAAILDELQAMTPERADNAMRLQALAPATATLVDMAQQLAGDASEGDWDELLFWSAACQRSVQSWQRDLAASGREASAAAARLRALAATARAFATEMDFAFLIDPRRRLLSIGYRVADGTLDPSCYDLLASEAHLASFVAIAKGDAPSRHWFRLGRSITPVGNGAALISWSGSMFEYLMPALVIDAPLGSLLERSNRQVVRRQIAYGDSLGLPWGISESAYNARDLELTYQYTNFGVPGLGLKRGLGDQAVIAPYATALAAMVEPASAARNFARIARLGGLGRHGFYEAIDYTRSRLPEGAPFAIVRAFMAHHQGMTVVALANVLLHGIVRRRFHAATQVQATALLLQERTPRDVPVAHRPTAELHTAANLDEEALPQSRRLHPADDATPQAHLLSNGRYALMVTAAGSGYSRWRGLAITRWREDATCDDTGSYVFLRDTDTGRVWSAGYQPCGADPEQYAALFSEDRAELQRSDPGLSTTLEIVVSPEDDAEVRRLSITNSGAYPRELEVTSYAELVLASAAADTAHPAFSKLFVQTEYVAKRGVLLATRRQRAPQDPAIWAGHHAVIEGAVSGGPEIETDRARFVGRGHAACAPIAVLDGRRLSGSVGAVLDPVFALRYRVRVPPGAVARIAFWTAVAETREGVLNVLDKHQDPQAFVRASTLAWTQAQVQLRHLGITAGEASLFQGLAGHVIHANGSLRSSAETIRRGGGEAAGLWGTGISGDLPIVLLRVDALEDMAIVRQLLQAHEYWQLRQLAVDLVILNERAPSYEQDLQVGIETLLRTSQSRGRPPADGARGAVFTLRTDRIPANTRLLLCAAARVVLVGQRGSLADQLERVRRPASLPVRRARARATPATGAAPAGRALEELDFFNGLGGFALDGREYVTRLGPGQTTPAPWINVLANPRFGCQISAEGAGYTWSLNSREHQLTPWSNDPVSDRPGEALYVRDQDSGELWSPTAAPIHDAHAFHVARHGQGYSRFEHESRGIALELLVFVPLADPVRIARLRIRNASSRVRRLSITAYVEWLLGSSRAISAPHVVTEIDPATQALFARNPWSAGFGARVAFADLAGMQTDWTADRGEFLGRHGTLAQPAALLGAARLSRRVGAGLDPCAALQTPVLLRPGESHEVTFLLGEAADAAQARELLEHYRAADVEAALREVVAHWDAVLGKIQVRTPERSMDLLLNRWALYQTLACRVWARSAFYQASGAYGFRDQLQDVMALAVTQPAITRAHLLRAAGRQFVAGDVQHWWLPQSGHGVRTRTSDDRIWLVQAVEHYLASSGDLAVLDEPVPFIDGQALRAGEHELYSAPVTADEVASLFEHCARALDCSLAIGEHGLPLIGTGDWNDGMNRVGEHGRGESVWLGWFLHATLTAFAPRAAARGEHARAAHWRTHAAALQRAIESSAWDGGWYRRGYYDDGTPLGSAGSDECRIDSIAQSWAVISGAADPARAATAMAAVDAQLIRRDSHLALLFTPPFDRTALEPGYIKGYPPGIRENGGQYTHAATWSVIAFALLGQGEKAAELFALLNPINRTATRTDVHRYKVEPYAIAADVYSVAPQAGRGGWTWYTGAAGWMYRAGIEWILGLRVEGASLTLSPCIPAHWPRVEISFRHEGTRYELAIENPDRGTREVVHAEADGRAILGRPVRIALVDDGAEHRVRIVLGAARPAAEAV